MSSDDDDDKPPTQLLRPLSYFHPPQSNLNFSDMATNASQSTPTPQKSIFSSRDEESAYTYKLLQHCSIYSGDPEQLSVWLRATGDVLSKEGYPETDHPFILRQLLPGDALDYYLAHDDIIFNFCDFRKLFLHKNNSLAHLRTLSSLDSITTLTLNPQ